MSALYSSYYNCDSTSIQLRFHYDEKNEHVYFFVASRGIVSNKKAVVRAYNDIIVCKGKDVDLYSAFHAPGTPNADTSLKLTRQTAI